MDVEALLQNAGAKVIRRDTRHVWIRCPWVEHKSTSFSVVLAGTKRGLAHCWACKKGWTLASVVAQLRGISVEAAKKVVATGNIEDGGRPRKPVPVFADLPSSSSLRFELTSAIIFAPFDEWVSTARAYAESRGITAEQVGRYRIGYCLEGRLAGFIVFPCLDGRGRATSYSARTFVDGEPRFQTPHRGENPDLGAVFGEHLWPPHPKRDVIAVTEGAIDALACERALPELCIGSLSGSDVRPGHILRIGTFRQILVVTDPDEPGDLAAMAIRSSVGRRCHVTRVRLEEGTDASSLPIAVLRRFLSTAL